MWSLAKIARARGTMPTSLDHQNQGTFEAHKRRKAQIRHKSPAYKSFVFSGNVCKLLKNPPCQGGALTNCFLWRSPARSCGPHGALAEFPVAATGRLRYRRWRRASWPGAAVRATTGRHHGSLGGPDDPAAGAAEVRTQLATSGDIICAQYSPAIAARVGTQGRPGRSRWPCCPRWPPPRVPGGLVRAAGRWPVTSWRASGAFLGHPLADDAAIHVGVLSNWRAAKSRSCYIGEFDFFVEEKQGMVAREDLRVSRV